MGKSVLFLHGLGGSGDDWNSMIPVFEKRGWRCEAPTLFQHLRTRKNPPEALNSLSLIDWIKAASDYADQLLEEEDEKPVIVGHCLGGFLAQKLAEFGQAKSVAFISPLVLNQEERKNSTLPIASLLLRQSSERVRQKSKLCDVGLTLSFLNKTAPDKRKNIIANMRYESTRLLNDISAPDLELYRSDTGYREEMIPSLFIGCGKDRIVSSAVTHTASDAWSKSNADTTFKNYENLGHWPFQEDAAEPMITYLESWLNTALMQIQDRAA